MPAEIEGGVVRLTLQNDGKLKHEAVVVAVGDTPLDQVKKDLTPVVRGEGRPTAPYLHFQGGVSLVPPGSSTTSALTLPPGKYVVVCSLTDADSTTPDSTGPDGAGPDSAGAAERPPKRPADRFHYDLGMATPFTVTTANTAALPASDGTVVARDYAFDLPPLTPGTKTLTLRNDGHQDHSLAVSEFPDGVDAATAKASFEALLAATPDHPPPDDVVVPSDVAFAGPLSAGGQTTFTLELKPNRTYVFACYMSDRSGGPLHAHGKGMVAYATVPPPVRPSASRPPPRGRVRSPPAPAS